MGTIVPVPLPGGRTSKPRTDAGIVATIVDALKGAAAGTPYLIGVVATKGQAGSNAYAYRNAVGYTHGVPVRGWSRTVADMRAVYAAAGVDQPEELRGKKGDAWAFGVERIETMPQKRTADDATVDADADADA